MAAAIICSPRVAEPRHLDNLVSVYWDNNRKCETKNERARRGFSPLGRFFLKRPPGGPIVFAFLAMDSLSSRISETFYEGYRRLAILFES